LWRRRRGPEIWIPLTFEATLEQPVVQTQTPEAAVNPDIQFQFLGYRGRWPTTFRALRHRNFRLFWFGQLISLTGSWMQMVAQGWLITELVRRQLHLEKSSHYLGMIGALGSAPMLLLSLFAGAIAEFHDKRRILIATQSALMILALTLGFLSGTGLIRLWHVAALMFLVGTVNAFDMPTRQSFVKDMAGAKDLVNAIALNSMVFNCARIIGPAIAGWLIAHTRIGMSGVFVLNGVSYLAVIAGLIMIRHQHTRVATADRNILRRLGEGFAYVRRNRTIRTLMIMMATYSVFGFSYYILMPAIARETLHLGAKGYGGLMSSTGAGALAGAVILASVSHRVRKGRILLAAGVTLSVALMAFSQVRQFSQAIAILPFAGAGLVVSTATINSLIQELAPDHLRSRVVSMWTFIFAGSSPVGALYAGQLAEHTSPAIAVFTGGAACLVLIVALSLCVPWIWKEK
jgi:MFS family permease